MPGGTKSRSGGLGASPEAVFTLESARLSPGSQRLPPNSPSNSLDPGKLPLCCMGLLNKPPGSSARPPSRASTGSQPGPPLKVPPSSPPLRAPGIPSSKCVLGPLGLICTVCVCLRFSTRLPSSRHMVEGSGGHSTCHFLHLQSRDTAINLGRRTCNQFSPLGHDPLLSVTDSRGGHLRLHS